MPTLRITQGTHQQLKEMALSQGQTMKSLIEEMVTWLAGQKMSPMELKKHLQDQKIRKKHPANTRL